MNGLKKLFSPSTLAATLATGLLLSSALVALATTCISATASTHEVRCAYQSCSGHDANGVEFWWCCSSPFPNCASCTVTDGPNQTNPYGFCTDYYPGTCCWQ